MPGVQSTVNTVQAPGVAGAFASANPRFTVLAGQPALRAGLAGLTVGRFAWLDYSQVDNDGAPALANNFGSGPVAGFVGREQQGLITQYLQSAGMFIPAGFQCTLYSGGDFWIVNGGAAQALPGQKCYARNADGTARFGAAGSPSTASGSASSIAANTLSVTGGIQGNVMTVTAVGSGTVVPGATLSGTGVASGTKVVSQLTSTETDGHLGGNGTYAVSIPEQNVAAGTTIAGTYGTLTVGGTVVAGFGVGDVISGTNVVTGTTITALGTGSGGAGTYIVDNNTVVSSTAITASTDVETSWIAASAGLPGELVKIHNVPGLS